ncbi:D-arabinono-1,4-lactone oxidase-domain-containing protein [Mycena crocata]|nr:D-arabinono-1,4-lactone oxidase-domain-containing protein [Mycena crocata]
MARNSLAAHLDHIAVTRPTVHNWARTFRCHPRAVFAPTTVQECQDVLALAHMDKCVLRPLGVGHSPSDVAFTDDYLLDTTRLCRVLHVSRDTTPPYVEAEAGIKLSALHTAVGAHGLAMRNLGSISDQTLAGIVATSTHGSGVDYGVISTHVLALTLLVPDSPAYPSPSGKGTVVRCSPNENPDLFTATICGLGATGLILSITLELEPAFRLKDTHTIRPLPEVLRHLDTIKKEGEHVRLWWAPAIGTVRCSVASRVTEPPTSPAPWYRDPDALLGFHALQLALLLTRFARPLPRPEVPRFEEEHPAPARTPASVTVAESWRVFNIECRYPQHTTEWALPAARARACLGELAAWLEGERGREGGERPHFPIEVRWSAGDDLWLSPSNGGETCWVGIVQFKPYNLPTRYRVLFAAFERILTKHGGRPHWAKAHHLDARTVRRLYPDFGKFLRVVQAVDPQGVFRNEYIERHLMGGGGDGREYKEWNASRADSADASTPQGSVPMSASTQTEDASQEREKEKEQQKEERPRAWWRRIWRGPAPKPKPEPDPKPDWRTDWRIAPPEGRRRRVRLGRVPLEGGEQLQPQTRAKVKVEAEEEEERDVHEESPISSEDECECESGSESESDMDATLAGSVELKCPDADCDLLRDEGGAPNQNCPAPTRT